MVIKLVNGVTPAKAIEAAKQFVSNADSLNYWEISNKQGKMINRETGKCLNGVYEIVDTFCERPTKREYKIFNNGKFTGFIHMIGNRITQIYAEGIGYMCHHFQ